MTRGRGQLDSSLAPMPLPLMLPPGATSQDKEAGLRNLVNVVRRALASLPGIRLWGEYAFTRASMADRLADGGSLGRDALETLARSVARGAAPIASRGAAVRRLPVYTALGPALCSLPEAARLMRGTRYPSALLHANVVLMDYVRREADEDGPAAHRRTGRPRRPLAGRRSVAGRACGGRFGVGRAPGGLGGGRPGGAGRNAGSARLRGCPWWSRSLQPRTP